MICKHCKTESDAVSRICPACGKYMGQEPLVAESVDASLYQVASQSWSGRPQPRQALGKSSHRKRRKRRSNSKRKDTYQGRMINWVKVAVLVAALLVFLLAGFLAWTQLNQDGQLMMARMGRKANATALWALGTEYLDQGYIGRSIETYLKAREQEPEREDIDQKLLLLAEAYEAAGQMGEAEKVYLQIIDLKPEKTTAYRLIISIMLSQDRQYEAVNMMQKAFENTEDISFYNQRSQLVPQPPKATLTSGGHLLAKDVEFYSTQDNEIWYTTGAGQLPESGTLYTKPLRLEEGTYNFRVVAVSGAGTGLVSDEMTIRYVITLPTPLAPKANMAPNTYEKPFRVSLRNVDEDKDVTIYYTIDGTKPDTNSPRYVGEPILMPRGRQVYLRAIAVNRYGKRSAEMNIEYKIKGGFKSYYDAKDQFSGFSLLSTSQEQFFASQGQPLATEDITDQAVSGSALLARYPWGEARFFQVKDKGMVLYYLHTNSSSHKGPRGSQVGQAIKDVTDRFRDMGQLPNDVGSRGIYYDMAEGYARYTVHSDDPTTGVLEYVYVNSPDASTYTLQYQIRSGKVDSIILGYMDHRESMVQQ